ncbi:MAG TPA: dTDP-glucose 4,6-dehydratase [Aurantimonas sp.]
MTILVTGGAGFIGANFLHEWLARSDEAVVNLDRMTYAGHPGNLSALSGDPRHRFIKGDIRDGEQIDTILREHRPRAIVHFAAESHVDRSIAGPEAFVFTNVVGTFNLLEAARAYHGTLADEAAAGFRFLHVSTDEVYGALQADDPPFTEASIVAPNSPYSASKAGSDHLVRAYFHTYGLPVLTSNCTNNYGPRQFPEKFIPVVIERALAFEPVPIYADGKNVRDWIHVADHCAALRLIMERGEPGTTYNVSAECERRNIDLATAICDCVDALAPDPQGRTRRTLLTRVADRPGHDFRYAMSAARLRETLGWRPERSFADGLRQTVAWYLDNRQWVAEAQARLACAHAETA